MGAGYIICWLNVYVGFVLGKWYEYKMLLSLSKIKIISLVFFISGCSALAFETIWFRVASIVLGSSVWSAAAVLMAFMTGLGIGNLLISRFGHRLKNSISFYVALELVIGVTGVLSVLFLPVLIPFMGVLIENFSYDNGVINLARFVLAFLVFLIPAVAMGTTLPVLQKVLYEYDRSFVRSFAHLYGWNTLGAVLGTLLAEFYLIEFVGIKGTALIACLLNFAAAFILLRINKKPYKHKPIEIYQPNLSQLLSNKILLLAPFITGLILLALEVVWFRYLLLMKAGNSHTFAIMLANVLVGIGMGGYIATRLVSRSYDIDKLLRKLLLLSALSVVVGYYISSVISITYFSHVVEKMLYFNLVASVLMLPSSILTGILFPFFAEKLFRKIPETTRASGLITFVNTMGAALGSGLATFVLLPLVGIEKSLFILAIAYIVVLLLMAFSLEKKQSIFQRLIVPCILVIIIASSFPSGMLKEFYDGTSKFYFPSEKIIKIKEGRNETLRYLEKPYFDGTLYNRLVTNYHSMSTTSFHAKRYMKLYAYFPYLMHDNITDVLQISYGVGNTAEAITRLDSVKKFDIVDISKDILELSSIVHNNTGWHPLKDKRSQVHIEDGRFFLQTTKYKYDLITGEPPPPKHIGVVNLYTEEYFKLLKSRLKLGGIVTYWLPVHSLDDSDTLSIIKSFCEAFDDCSLWSASLYDYMLVGSNGGLHKLSMERINEIWSLDIAAEFKRIGLEKPTQFATMFMADAKELVRLTREVLPVTDDFPHRISPYKLESIANSKLNFYLIDINLRRKRFNESDYIKTIFPKNIIKKSIADFDLESIFLKVFLLKNIFTDVESWNELNYLLTKTKVETLPLLYLNSSPIGQSILKNTNLPLNPEYQMGIIKGVIAKREFKKARQLLNIYINTFGITENNIFPLKLYYYTKALNGELTMNEIMKAKHNFSSNEEYIRWEEFIIWLVQNFIENSG